MKTIDGKSIEELRIGQEVWVKGKMRGTIKSIYGTDSTLFVGKNFASDMYNISEVSTTKPKVMVKKKFYCFENSMKCFWWSLEENNVEYHRSTMRVPEKDFEQEVWE